MDNLARVFGAVAALIGVGTAIYGFLKARREYHATHARTATVLEPGASPARTLWGIKVNTIVISIAAYLLLCFACLALIGDWSASILQGPKPSEPSKRKPIDPRIVGKWVIQEPIKVWLDSADFPDRSIVFTSGGKFAYAAKGTYYEDIANSKKGDKRTQSFSGPFWFLDDGKIEFIDDRGDALVMGIDWISDNEVLLVESGESGTRNRYLETHLKGTLTRSK